MQLHFSLHDNLYADANIENIITTRKCKSLIYIERFSSNQMQANPDNGWIQIESMGLVGFEFKARKATVGGIQISEGRRLVELKIPLFVPRI